MYMYILTIVNGNINVCKIQNIYKNMNINNYLGTYKIYKVIKSIVAKTNGHTIAPLKFCLMESKFMFII